MRKPDFANIANAAYVDEMYQRYLENPDAVDGDWAFFFAGFEMGRGAAAPDAPAAKAAKPAGTADAPRSNAAAPALREPSHQTHRPHAHPGHVRRPRSEESTPALGVFDLIHSYRELGHMIAELDPLGDNATTHELLELEEFGFTENDLDTTIPLYGFGSAESAKLGELVDFLRRTYCGTVAVEYMYISNKAHREWIQERIEPTLNKPRLTREERRRIYEQVHRANAFERFVHTKYVGQKRFSLEGGESLVPLLLTLIEETGDLGVREVVMGMPHRGRLNVLTHVLGKPYERMFSEFEGTSLPDSVQGDGDVKYHLGYSRDYTTGEGRDVHLSLLFNPSHLEAINPVAEGIVAGKQHYLHDSEGTRVMPILMHGDAAFMGQGVVMETLALSELSHYHTGGTIHVIVNNRVGFTTSPRDYRFTRYPTEIAKLIQAPVLHVNGDDPEAAVQAARIAAEFRQEFKEDILIDLVCYRRHGHNEIDDPTFTQPLMYEIIKRKPTVDELYRQRLVEEGALSEEEADAIATKVREEFDKGIKYARDFLPKQEVQSFGGAWKGYGYAGEDWGADTRVRRGALERVVRHVQRVPEGFTPHGKVAKLYQDRAKMIADGGPIDWGCGEMLAIGTLLLEGTTVRLSGQDSGRGTFSHRHAAVYDTANGNRHVPLDHMDSDQGRFYLVDSNLSEAGVLGFEYGFSSADPRNLVLWEAQFGDFANGAQVIIDQFIASAESKWQRLSGIVLLLPHGYEGQGPEHSSARLERFLTMCAEQNMQVCNLTTPAQLFHVLRRQVHRNFRKPLIIMSPKSMLRNKACVSAIDEFTERVFRPVLDDPADLARESVRRVLLCSGKVYYDLIEARESREIDDVAIVRLEQLYPFPLKELRDVLATYPASAEVFWVQEEPKNMGAWRFISDRNFMIFDDGRELTYVGRESAASPAVGSYNKHQAELRALLDAALRESKVTELRQSHGS
jgi:2-oxoglutarate dehydrogenase E1 component